MTAQEAAAFIISRWRLEHSAEAIMMACVLTGAPLKKKAQILAVIRRYVEVNSENATYKRRNA